MINANCKTQNCRNETVSIARYASKKQTKPRKKPKPKPNADCRYVKR